MQCVGDFAPEVETPGRSGNRKLSAFQIGVERLAHSAHLHLAAASHAQVEFSREALMQGPTLCAQCDLPEDRCACEKYCTICKGQQNVRLCSDGLSYSPHSRDPSELSLATTRAP